VRESGVSGKEVLWHGWDDIRSVKRKGNESAGRNDGTTILAWDRNGERQVDDMYVVNFRGTGLFGEGRGRMDGEKMCRIP
jgi:hypothetical protein